MPEPEPKPESIAELAVTRREESDRIAFDVGGRPFTAYVFGDPAAERPYFFPLLGPDGAPLTRRFPMEEGIAGEPTDHPHHRSLWTAHGDINGTDNWNARPNHGYTRFRRLEDGLSEDTLVAHADITTHDGALLLHERLQVRIRPVSADATLIDWRVTLTAPEGGGPVRLGDTKECGLCAVRVAAPLQGDRGGRIEDADGRVSEKECWGRPSRWCDYSGGLAPGGPVVGVAILSHPSTHGHPTHWHVRDYGLFAANPFGLSAFTKGAEDGALELAPGASLDFRYAVLTHRGDAHAADVEGVWREWSQS